MKSTFKTRFAAILLASLWASTAWSYDPLNREEYLAKIKEAKALYEDRCKNVAGIKIYKTVPDVEGLLLMKIRPERTDRELADPNWPGAAFGREARGNGYIESFLGSEHRVVEKDGSLSRQRGYISPRYPQKRDYIPGREVDLPGYRWVELPDPKDGQRYRYSARYEERWQTDKRYLKGDFWFSLGKTPSPSKTPPRYAVTFEDHVIPEERALWVASSTVKVLDLKTNEVLGEMTIYAMSYIHAPRQSMPWLNHSVCPVVPGTDGQDTRKFVDQILIPKKEQ